MAAAEHAVLLLRIRRVMKKRNANSQRGKCMPRIFAILNSMGGEGSVGRLRVWKAHFLSNLCRQKT